MESLQDDTVETSDGRLSSELKKRINVPSHQDAPSTCESKTPVLEWPSLRPRRLLKISFACNILFICIWLGFHLLIEFSGDHCQSNLNVTALNISMRTEVVGQTAGMKELVSKLAAYAQNASIACLAGRPSPGLRPFMIAMYGGSGTGKTFIVDKLAKHFGKPCSNHFIIPVHFHIQKSNPANNLYRNQITTALHVSASSGSCLLRLLVLEDVDSIPAGVLSGLVLATLTWSTAYVPTVVIMTSSLGSRLVTDYMVTGSRRRNDVDQTLLSQLTNKAAVAAHTPWGDTVARGNLVLHNIYLLPLESRHLRQCIENKLNERGIWKKDWVQIIMNHSAFFEVGTIKFARYGCKTVDSDIVYWSGA